MISVRRAYELDNRIPEHIFKYLPVDCEYCKSPMVLNDEYTRLRCSNYSCRRHLAYRASNAFEKLGMKGFGPKLCRDLLRINNLSFHLDILSLTEEQFPSNMGKDTREKLYSTLQQNRTIDLPFLLELAQVDGIAGKTSERLVGDYNSFDAFFSEHSSFEKLLAYYKKALNRRRVTRESTRITYALWKQKEDLLRIEKLFIINQRAELKLRVCMTGDIVSATVQDSFIRPRSKFIDLLNLKYKDIATFINAEKSINGSDILLTDSNRKTKKYNYALKNNIEIMTFGSFIELLETSVGQGDLNVEFKTRRG